VSHIAICEYDIIRRAYCPTRRLRPDLLRDSDKAEAFLLHPAE
jgi:hypothetical protein